MNLKAILADIDGTLTEGGNLSSVHPELKEAILTVREKGILFNLASGRNFFDQESFHRVLIEPENYKQGEAILYEGSCIRFLGDTKIHRLGGLSRERIQEIQDYIYLHGLFEGMVHRNNEEFYETVVGYVTPTFISEGRTDKTLLQQTFHHVKPILEQKFPLVDVIMSADAVEVTAKGINKKLPTVVYSELSHIPLEQIAAIGDAANDLPMLDVVGKAGGVAVYVGTRPEQERIVGEYLNHYIPIPARRGILGTADALYHLLQSNL